MRQNEPVGSRRDGAEHLGERRPLARVTPAAWHGGLGRGSVWTGGPASGAHHTVSAATTLALLRIICNCIPPWNQRSSTRLSDAPKFQMPLRIAQRAYASAPTCANPALQFRPGRWPPCLLLVRREAAWAAEQPAAMAPSEAIFIVQLVVLMLVGRLLGEALLRLRQPAVMGQLMAGLVLGPSLLGALFPGCAARAVSGRQRAEGDARRRCRSSACC